MAGVVTIREYVGGFMGIFFPCASGIRTPLERESMGFGSPSPCQESKIGAMSAMITEAFPATIA